MHSRPLRPETRLDELPLEECLRRLRAGSVGRIAVVVDDFPVVVPINYRLVETAGRPRVIVRTRSGNIIERASLNVAFEIDEIDPSHHQGWSVLIRGTLQHIDPDAAEFRESFDPHPWLPDERDSWLIMEPFSITGRCLQLEAPGALESNRASTSH
jgi:nitroimidazol reductase NimA-like FMN-containing flavoprotein (pyridoxamine 5'-phosphate oxidase superfamily)